MRRSEWMGTILVALLVPLGAAVFHKHLFEILIPGAVLLVIMLLWDTRARWIRMVPFYLTLKFGLRRNHSSEPTAPPTIPEGGYITPSAGTAGTIFTVATRPSDGPSLAILEAWYGAGTARVDVVDKLNVRIQNGRLIAVVDNVEFSDPAVGETKWLSIRYTYRGIGIERRFIEGSYFTLPTLEDQEAVRTVKAASPPGT
jgi:hypothetical protein